MLTLVTRAQIAKQEAEVERVRKAADKLTRSKLDKLREEMAIPPRELNKLAKEVVGREFGDYRFLTGAEVKKVERYLKQNYDVISSRYRKLRWS